jgi:hypothetical protein
MAATLREIVDLCTMSASTSRRFLRTFDVAKTQHLFALQAAKVEKERTVMRWNFQPGLVLHTAPINQF